MDYSPPVKAALYADFSIIFDEAVAASLCQNAPKIQGDFDFDAAAIAVEIRKIGCVGLELLHFLQYVFADYSANTPPVS